MTARRVGRRPGASGSRQAILVAARRRFADVGYQRATLRSIAAEAGVDPALVLHYFGTKQRLFVAVSDVPIDPAAVVSAGLDGDPDQAGRRFVTFVCQVLEQQTARETVVGMIRAAVSEPDAAAALRELLMAQLFEPMTTALGPDREAAALRASALGAWVVGLVMARYVVRIEPLASADVDQVVDLYGPMVQRLLLAERIDPHP